MQPQGPSNIYKIFSCPRSSGPPGPARAPPRAEPRPTAPPRPPAAALLSTGPRARAGAAARRGGGVFLMEKISALDCLSTKLHFLNFMPFLILQAFDRVRACYQLPLACTCDTGSRVHFGDLNSCNPFLYLKGTNWNIKSFLRIQHLFFMHLE